MPSTNDRTYDYSQIRALQPAYNYYYTLQNNDQNQVYQISIFVLFLKFAFLSLFARYQFYIRLSTQMFCEFIFCHQFHTFAGFFFSTGAGLAFCQTKKEDIYFKYSNGKLHNKRELQWKEDNCRWHWVHFSFVIISQNNSFALNFIHKKQQQCMRPVFLRSLPAPAALTIFFPIEIRGRKLSIRTAEITILHDPN